MMLFHGSNTNVDRVDLERCRPYKGFSASNNKYDMVMDPVADDDLVLLFRQFEGGMLEAERLAVLMKSKSLNDQYSFHTEAAVRLLGPVGSVRL